MGRPHVGMTPGARPILKTAILGLPQRPPGHVTLTPRTHDPGSDPRLLSHPPAPQLPQLMLAGRPVHTGGGSPARLRGKMARFRRIGMVRALVGTARRPSRASRDPLRRPERHDRAHALHLGLPGRAHHQLRLVEAQQDRHDRAGLPHPPLPVEGAPRGGDGRAGEPRRRPHRPTAVRGRGRRSNPRHRHQPRLLHHRRRCRTWEPSPTLRGGRVRTA